MDNTEHETEINKNKSIATEQEAQTREIISHEFDGISSMNDNKTTNNLLKRARDLNSIAFFIFLIVFIIIVSSMLSEMGCKCDGASKCFCGVETMIHEFFAVVPIIVSMVLAGRGISTLRKLNKQGIEAPQWCKILGIISLLQIPIFVVITALWFALQY